MALGPDDLVLCAGTLARASIRERIGAARAGGYRGLSLFPSDVRRARAEGDDDATLRALLADHGLEVAELDPLISWVPGALPTPEPFQTSERECYQIADALGARSLNCVVFAASPIPQDAVVEAFAGVCDRAADHGLLVHLEFMPWTQIATALDALAIVEGANRKNGGILLDTWHHFRGPLSNDELRLRVPADRILAVQLNDAPRRPEPNLVDETLHRRRVPGAGDIDLPAILRGLRDGGSTAPLGIEVFCDELDGLEPADIARRCADGVRAALARR